ncbi:flagellar hook assembly protein FlgD [Humitalea sp. 24SJ18S-53]|uniref:flagellar hook assembly protein FlgD n=1 Tax=Humitalea sp. 24SJ18S-53 TaxID=3422307 RepID=UPI003D66AE38
MASTITTATNLASTGTSAAAAPTANLFGDFKTFLTMLTTQLQNQDPSSPLDTNQMTQQLVQFASVEQQIGMNQTLGSLVSLQQTAQLTAAGPLIGQRVEISGDRMPLQGGTGTLRLPAAGAATQARVQVKDAASGRALFETQVPLSAQPQDWVWNGQDANGRQLADGAYQVTVSGLGANGGAVPLTATIIGTATAAERQDNDLKLSLGAVSVGFDQVRAVRGR